MYYNDCRTMSTLTLAALCAAAFVAVADVRIDLQTTSAYLGNVIGEHALCVAVTDDDGQTLLDHLLSQATGAQQRPRVCDVRALLEATTGPHARAFAALTYTANQQAVAFEAAAKHVQMTEPARVSGTSAAVGGDLLTMANKFMAQIEAFNNQPSQQDAVLEPAAACSTLGDPSGKTMSVCGRARVSACGMPPVCENPIVVPKEKWQELVTLLNEMPASVADVDAVKAEQLVGHALRLLEKLLAAADEQQQEAAE